MRELSASAPPAPGSTGAAPLPGVKEAPWDRTLGASRVLFGSGQIDCLGQVAADLGGRRVLVVTDPGIRQAGHVARAEAALGKAGLEVIVFDGVEVNPTTRHVEAGVACARQARIDLIVGLGGGSSMDCAKGINFVLTNGGRMEDYWGTGKADHPMLPSVGVPTTAGTGSEAQTYALIVQEATHAKMACGDEKARFRAVILDPDLTASLPRRQTAVTALDAMGHALESYVCTRAGDASRRFAREAWRLLEMSLEAALADPGDGDARARLLWGAHLAGAAIDRSMLGAAHACANPLTARHGVEHGVAVALMLPHVVRFNGEARPERYAGLAGAAEGAAGPEALARRVEELRAAGGMPAQLREVGVSESSLDSLAAEAAGQWTAGFNPRPVGKADLEQIYRRAY